uniref:Uncharacterized protein n=1 Tax=viral metagenome TaxID=1070528 RepID=A0A6C0J9G2_9ZZZZ
MAHKLTTKSVDFDHTRLSFSPWDDKSNGTNQKQKICYPRYDHPTLGPESPLMIQFPWTNIFKYGIPSIGEYYATDKDRAFLKLPLDLSDKEVKQLYDQLVALDKVMSSTETKEERFGKKLAKKVKYVPIVKNTDTDEDDDSPPWMKLKIKLSYPDEDVITEVWESVKDETDPKGKKRTRTRLEVNNVQEFQNNVSYLANVCIIAKPVKMWSQALNLPEPTYGVTWRMEKIQVEPRTSSNSLDKYKNNDAFIDSDEEDVTNTMSSSVVETEAVDENSNDDESDDSDDDSDSEDEAPPKPSLKKKKDVKTKKP